MARGINKVILVGNLGADPDTRYMPSGKAVTNIRIATSESWKDKQTGDQQERTEWHSIVHVRQAGRDRRRIPAQGLAGLHRRQAADPQVAGQGRQGSLHHRDHRRRDADARWPRRRRWRRSQRAPSSGAAPSRAAAGIRGALSRLRGAGGEAASSTTTYRSESAASGGWDRLDSSVCSIRLSA